MSLATKLKISNLDARNLVELTYGQAEQASSLLDGWRDAKQQLQERNKSLESETGA